MPWGPPSDVRVCLLPLGMLGQALLQRQQGRVVEVERVQRVAIGRPGLGGGRSILQTEAAGQRELAIVCTALAPVEEASCPVDGLEAVGVLVVDDEGRFLAQGDVGDGRFLDALDHVPDLVSNRYLHASQDRAVPAGTGGERQLVESQPSRQLDRGHGCCV